MSSLHDAPPPERLSPTRTVELPPPLVRRLGLAQARGLMVVEVERDGSAAEAGILPGDVLLVVDRIPHEDGAALADYLAQREAGPVRLQILRGGAVRAVVATPRGDR